MFLYLLLTMIGAFGIGIEIGSDRWTWWAILWVVMLTIGFIGGMAKYFLLVSETIDRIMEDELYPLDDIIDEYTEGE